MFETLAPHMANAHFRSQHTRGPTKIPRDGFIMNTGGLAVRSFARAVLVESTIADCTAPVSGGGGICALSLIHISEPTRPY